MSEPLLRIITTGDGSHSLHRTDMNETYHSFHGARSESEYVFIKTGLEYFLFKHQPNSIRIFEVGLGTGLNALLSAKFAEKLQVRLDYHSIEPIPLSPELYSQLNYGANEEEKKCLQEIHQAAWNQSCQITPFFNLTKYETKLEQFDRVNGFDIIYFDAFAPSKQPEVWAPENIDKCFSILNPSGILNTYCAQGQFKRNLKAAGFDVEILPGALGKKEMVRAVKV